jgi:hypothetical protein
LVIMARGGERLLLGDRVHETLARLRATAPSDRARLP